MVIVDFTFDVLMFVDFVVCTEGGKGDIDVSHTAAYARINDGRVGFFVVVVLRLRVGLA